MASFEPVNAVSRALKILVCVNQHEIATIAQLYQETGLHKSTILRMLESLIHDGFVTRLPDGRGYTVTGKCTSLSRGFNAPNAISRVANSLLSDFRRESGWPADIAIYDHDAMYIALTDRQFGTMSLNRQVGARAPVLMSSLGIAYLAFSDDAFVSELIQRLAESSDPYDAPARDPAQLREKLAAVRARGYATPDPFYVGKAYQDLISAIAVPILVNQKVYASVNVMYHKANMTEDLATQQLLPKISELARQIGFALDEEYGY